MPPPPFGAHPDAASRRDRRLLQVDAAQIDPLRQRGFHFAIEASRWARSGNLCRLPPAGHHLLSPMDGPERPPQYRPTA
jgi:hypothetical protein